MTLVFESYAAFLSREDKNINGVSPEFAKNNPRFEADNEINEGCWNCSGCFDCSDCSDCFDCSDCSDWINNKPPADLSKPPIIENIHQKVLEAVKAEGNSLKMSDWHTCDTAHCRAGWVVHLAGKAGKAYEKQTSTEFAAKQIYKASSPIAVSSARFYEDNETAMADIIRCAEEEKSQKQ